MVHMSFIIKGKRKKTLNPELNKKDILINSVMGC